MELLFVCSLKCDALIIYKISTHDKPFNSLCLDSILSKQLSNYHLASHVGQLATPVQVCQPM